MARYSVSGNATNTASKTMLGITGSTTKQLRVKEFHIAFDATPADMATRFQVKRSTAAGTSTAWTPVALDSSAATATFTAGYNHTVEPTYTANAVLLDIAVNQRQGYDWYALDAEEELVVPATASNGLGWFVNTTNGSAVNCVITVIVEE